MVKDYLPGAEPLFLEGSDRGCLLLHGGGGGTTWDLKEFANLLHSETGMTIWLPALIGYGTTPEDLKKVTFKDLLLDAQHGLDRLLESCDEISVVGHSFGGLLALVLAASREEVTRIVTWAAPVKVKNRMLSLLPSLSKIPLLKRAVPETYDAPVPQWLKDQGWVGYEKLPTSVGFVMLDAMDSLKERLHRVQCPTLVIQGSADSMVSEDSAPTIYESIASNEKDLLIIEGADHPMMNQSEYKDELFIRTIDFLRKS